ncbi:MAG: hypothetical protein ACK56F_09450, partial [bacterium]
MLHQQRCQQVGRLNLKHILYFYQCVFALLSPPPPTPDCFVGTPIKAMPYRGQSCRRGIIGRDQQAIGSVADQCI